MRIVQNNVVGTGIGVQAQVANARGALMTGINNNIEDAWSRWIEKDTCHTAGLLGLPEILRLVMGQQVEAGEMMLRKIRKPFGKGRTPFALEVIEADRLIDQYSNSFAPNGNMIRMGVEIDDWSRPVGYWLYPNHPGDYQFQSFVPARFVRCEAAEILHPYIVERWPQTRGVPWFHAVLRRLNDMGGYGDAEIVAARASANIVGFITTPDPQPGDDVESGQRVIDSEPGTFKQLLPGEDFTGFNPSRPNTGLEPFMRFLLRSIAAGIGVSYESLSRDYSQSNYSSSRLALLDDRDLWRMLQGWLIRNVLWDIYREWLEAAVMAGEVRIPDFYANRAKYEAVRFKPRGWSWVDPTKEVTAFKTAVRCGFMTVSDVIAQTAGGADAEDVFKGRRQELDMMADLDLIFDSDPAQVDDKGKDQTVEPPVEGEDAPVEPGEAATAEGGAAAEGNDNATE